MTNIKKTPYLTFNKKLLTNKLADCLKDTRWGIGLTAQEKGLDFLEMLHKWNKFYNLTAINNPKEMLYKHLLDSFSLVPHIKNKNNILDVGTGAGMPGIPLAIAYPKKQFFLIEAKLKKVNFIKQVKIELSLNNIEVINTRIEKFIVCQEFDIIVSRAFASLKKFLSLTSHLGGPKTSWLAMKGLLQDKERAGVPNDFFIEKEIPISIPGAEFLRSIIVVKKGSK